MRNIINNLLQVFEELSKSQVSMVVSEMTSRFKWLRQLY